jgi:hypothetical protein
VGDRTARRRDVPADRGARSGQGAPKTAGSLSDIGWMYVLSGLKTVLETGRTVNIAARIAEGAGPGEVLVTQEVIKQP